jgi:hypothetical protein
MEGSQMKYFQIAALVLVATVALAGCGGGSTVIPPVVTIESLAPDIGPLVGGTEIMIKGTNFSPDTIVTLADQAVTDLVIVDSETITCRTPPAEGGTRAGVLVQNATGLAYELNVFFYIPPPQVFGLSPDTGPPTGLIPVSISGKGFVEFDAGVNTVTVGGLPATDVVTVSDSTITCVIPTGLGPAVVTVTNNNGSGSKSAGYRYFPPPTVFSITPAEGTPLGGTAVTILGTGFQANSPGANTVTFNNVAATSITTVDDNTITCVTPSRDGLATVKVSNSNGAGTLVDGFLFYPRPTLTAVTPDTGSSAGGVAMTLTGSGFLDNFPGTNTVRVDGVAATNVVVVNDTTITCVSPETGAGPVNVSVQNANGTASLSGAYSTLLSALLGSNGTKLFRIDTSNGATSEIGEIGFTPTAMAVSPGHICYAVTTSQQLITIDLATGAGTAVANLSPTVAIDDLTFNGTRLLGMYSPTGQTYEINPSTAAVTTKARFQGRTGTHRRGFEYHGAGYLYMPYYSNDWNPGGDAGTMFAIDPDTGSQSLGSLLNNAHAIMSLAMYKGVLYGIDNQPGGQGNNLTLCSIDVDDASAVQLGSLPGGMHVLAGTP